MPTRFSLCLKLRSDGVSQRKESPEDIEDVEEASEAPPEEVEDVVDNGECWVPRGGGRRRSGLAHVVTRAWRRADPGRWTRVAAGDSPAGTAWEVSRALLLTSMTLLDPGTGTLHFTAGNWTKVSKFDS